MSRSAELTAILRAQIQMEGYRLSQVDQFESVFRSAVKPVFDYQPVEIGSVLLVTDLDKVDAETYQSRVRTFLETATQSAQADYFLVTGADFKTTSELLDVVAQYQPDLICSYRNLHSKAWQFPHSLGEHLDVMLQQTKIPVMVLPHPEAGYEAEHALRDSDQVMVVTDLQAVNDHLINYAAALTQPAGTLYLTHVEDEDIFNRYIEAISKIDVIDTVLAKKRLHEQLLKEPEDYFHSCAEVLGEHLSGVTVRSLVTFGQVVEEYRHHIESQQLDLLVLSAKDERQHAMHSVAYPLAVELRQIPLLLL